jgi:hypothetical protein
MNKIRKNEESPQSTLDSKNFVMGDLNKSIESVVMKGKEYSINVGNIGMEPNSGTRSIKPKDHKNCYSPSIPINNKHELYCIQEEKEIQNDRNVLGVYDSFVTTTQDTKDNKTDDANSKFFGTHGSSKSKNTAKYINFAKKHDHMKLNNNELEAVNSRKMKRTDGFMAFRPSIGAGNSSNSLLPSSSGDTIANK